jgi:hypothetical protein
MVASSETPHTHASTPSCTPSRPPRQPPPQTASQNEPPDPESQSLRVGTQSRAGRQLMSPSSLASTHGDPTPQIRSSRHTTSSAAGRLLVSPRFLVSPALAPLASRSRRARATRVRPSPPAGLVYRMENQLRSEKYS